MLRDKTNAWIGDGHDHGGQENPATLLSAGFNARAS